MMPRIMMVLLVIVLGAGSGCDKVRVGDRWLWQFDTKAPDKSPFPDCNEGFQDYRAQHYQHVYTVLETKQDWVKAVDETGRMSCSREDVFKVDAKRIAPKRSP